MQNKQFENAFNKIFSSPTPKRDSRPSASTSAYGRTPKRKLNPYPVDDKFSGYIANDLESSSKVDESDIQKVVEAYTYSGGTSD